MPDVVQVFGAGLSQHPSNAQQATLVLNMLMDADGILRQRMGLKLIREFSDLVYLLATCYSPFAAQHRILIIAASATATKEYLSDRAGIGAVGFTDISAIIAPGAIYGTHRPGRWTVNIPTNPAAANSIIHYGFPHNVPALVGSDLLLGRALASYQQLDAAAATIKGVAFSHGYHAMVVQPAANRVQWSTYAQGETWPVANYKNIPATIGQGIAGQGLNNSTSYIFGTHGILRLQGDIQSRFVWDDMATASAIYPGGHITRCRDRIFYIAPGPKIVSVGVDFDRIDLDIANQLRSSYLNSNTMNSFYDDLHDCYCIAGLDVSGGFMFMYNCSQKRWQGAFSYDSANAYSITMGALGAPAQKSGVTTYPLSYTPFQDQYVIASTGTASRLLRYDPTLAYDEVASGASQNFPISLETQSIPCNDRSADKQALEIYVDGCGTWDISLVTRNAVNENFLGFTTTVIRTAVTLPARVAVPTTAPIYKDARVLISGTSQALPSATSAAIRSVAVNQRELGQSLT